MPAKGKKYRIIVLGHALERFRERWPDASAQKERFLCDLIRMAIDDAIRKGTVINSPTGTLYHFSFMGKDGYIAMRGNVVTTLIPAEWCPEANEVMKESYE